METTFKQSKKTEHKLVKIRTRKDDNKEDMAEGKRASIKELRRIAKVKKKVKRKYNGRIK